MTNLPQFPLPKATLSPVGKFGKFCHIRKIRLVCHLQKGPLALSFALVICIDLLVAGDVGEFATFAKLTLFAEFTIFVKFAILDTRKGGLLVVLFALTCCLLAKFIVKIPSKAMQRLVGNFGNFANFVVACISGHKWIWVKRQAKHTKERRASFLKGAFALTMATVKTIPHNINLIGRFTKNNKSVARAARTLEHFFQCLCQVQGKQTQ